MRKQYRKSEVFRLRPSDTKPVVTFEQRVMRVYPKACCVDTNYTQSDDRWEIWCNNGTGNIVAASNESPKDAWKKAAEAIAALRP